MASRVALLLAASLLAGCGSATVARPAPRPPPGMQPPSAPPPPPQPDGPGLLDSMVVCARCSPELLAAKREGILEALGAMREALGSDLLPGHGPITFHLDGDATCGNPAETQKRMGYVTGYSSYDKEGHAFVCLFDVEKDNRALPFTPENAKKREDQLLPVHEAGHVWLAGRADYYVVQEPLVKLLSFVISGAVPDPCRSFRVDKPPDNLIPALCDAGMHPSQVPAIFRAIAIAARTKGKALDNDEVAQAVSDVIGNDARPAFRAAHLL